MNEEKLVEYVAKQVKNKKLSEAQAITVVGVNRVAPLVKKIKQLNEDSIDSAFSVMLTPSTKPGSQATRLSAQSELSPIKTGRNFAPKDVFNNSSRAFLDLSDPIYSKLPSANPDLLAKQGALAKEFKDFVEKNDIPPEQIDEVRTSFIMSKFNNASIGIDNHGYYGDQRLQARYRQLVSAHSENYKNNIVV